MRRARQVFLNLIIYLNRSCCDVLHSHEKVFRDPEATTNALCTERADREQIHKHVIAPVCPLVSVKFAKWP